MIGQAIDLGGQRYNIVILAGGSGTRMGIASDYIPKALTKLGNRRAIDYIIDRYQNVVHRIIIGTHSHADLLESYVRGNYPSYDIEFTYEDKLVNNAVSATYAIDRADIKYPTIVTFCDLLVVSNPIIHINTAYVANKFTKGNVGTFRHTLDGTNFLRVDALKIHENPIKLENELGVLGHFVFGNTVKLKELVLKKFTYVRDFTIDIVAPYILIPEIVETVYEFGTDSDLETVRRLWENAKY